LRSNFKVTFFWFIFADRNIEMAERNGVSRKNRTGRKSTLLYRKNRTERNRTERSRKNRTERSRKNRTERSRKNRTERSRKNRMERKD
jgi:hypothetical protein